MGKRFWSLVLTTALIAGVFSALPARAQVPPVPATVSIDDPFQDANYLNDQGNAGTGGGGQSVPFVGDNVTPADASTVADLGKIWFAHTADKISVFVQTQAPLGANAPAYVYDVFASAGEGTVSSSTFWCLRFSALVPGVAQGQPTTWQGKPLAKLIDRCNVGSNYWSNGIEGELAIGEGPEGTGILSMTFPRSASPLLADGAVVSAPYARSANVVGAEAASAFVSAPQVDNTKKGLDYQITPGGGGPVVSEPGKPKPKPTPPGHNNPPGKGKKKGCGKGKGKQKGACPQPPASSSCTPYAPGDMGKDAATTIVTDAATKDKPIEVDVPLGPASGSYGSDRTTRMKHNVQVDSAAAETGLFARLESPAGDDPDLYAYWPEGGKPAATVGGFNPLLVAGPLPNPTNHAIITSLNGQGAGGHSEFTAEQIDGLKTADCQGWTLDLVNWAGRGGYKLKLWLGAPENDPAPPAEAQDFYSFLMSF